MAKRSASFRLADMFLPLAAVAVGAVLAAVSRQRTPHAGDAMRAGEAGRGRAAAAPTDIPARGWKDILWRVYAEMGKDRLLAVAAGVVFYSLLAIFPAITAFVSAYGLFADTSTVSEHLSVAAIVMPPGAFDIVNDQIARITGNGGAKLTFAFLFSFALALWSANAGMKAMFDALNVIYEEDEKRSFVRLNLVSLAFTVGAIVVVMLAVGAIVVFPLAIAFLGVGGIVGPFVDYLRWPALFVLATLALSVLYRYGPSRRRAKWRWLSVGAVFAAAAWLAVSLLFSWYLSNFADYNATYGSLGAVIGLMMWMWLSTIVVLLGAELNAETEHQTARDSTAGAFEKPLGARGARMADTIGAAQG